MVDAISGNSATAGLPPITAAVASGEVYDIGELIEVRLAAGHGAVACLEAMVAGLEETGRRFESGEVFVPEMMMAADTFKAGMETLAPHLSEGARRYTGTVVLGTVQGDVHDIGKNLVGFLLESSGCRLVDLGVDVSPTCFVQAVQDYDADVLALSALLTTTMLCMADVVQALEAAGLRDRVKVIVGGAPVSKRFAEQIGADAYAATAPEGVKAVRAWLSASPGSL
jgi:5-methyltetrahydrofolate--homocysteine methyltransferase